MNKCFLKLTVLFMISAIGVLLNGCTKDLSEIVAGEYNGEANVYFFGSRPSQLLPDVDFSIVKTGETTITLAIISSSFSGNGSSEYNVKYDGTFGTGFHTPRGTVFAIGNEGQFIKDSLYFSYGSFDSTSNYVFSFKGRKL